jgi:hypothetical protein
LRSIAHAKIGAGHIGNKERRKRRKNEKGKTGKRPGTRKETWRGLDQHDFQLAPGYQLLCLLALPPGESQRNANRLYSGLQALLQALPQ